MKTCPNCGTEAQLTREHLIPKWFIYRVINFGLSHKEIMKIGNIDSLTSELCAPCNNIKGGIIDYSDPTVRKYLRTFVEMLSRHIDAAEAPKKLIHKCDCIPTPLEKEEIIKEVLEVHKKGTPPKPLSPHRCWKDRKCWCVTQTQSPAPAETSISQPSVEVAH